MTAADINAYDGELADVCDLCLGDGWCVDCDGDGCRICSDTGDCHQCLGRGWLDAS